VDKKREGGRVGRREGEREAEETMLQILQRREGGEGGVGERDERQLASDSCSLCNRSRSGEIS
jgi:hypothetical protein